MGLRQLAIIQASLGGFDKDLSHVPQSLAADFYKFTDDNFPPRPKAMSARLQAKIPKMFGWQLKPGYETYLWLDGNILLSNHQSLTYLYDQVEDYEFLVLRHPVRPNIRQETRYLRKGLREQSIYLINRYQGEWTLEQSKNFTQDKDYLDDLLVLGGAFMYRNTEKVQAMMKEWWYQTTRYSVFDQLAFAYCLKKSGVKVKTLDLNLKQNDYLQLTRHR